MTLFDVPPTPAGLSMSFWQVIVVGVVVALAVLVIVWIVSRRRKP